MWVYTCCILLVSTYLYRHVLCFFMFLCSVVVCTGSYQHHPEGTETLRLGQPTMVCTCISHRKNTTQLPYTGSNLFQANPVGLSFSAS